MRLLDDLHMVPRRRHRSYANATAPQVAIFNHLCFCEHAFTCAAAHHIAQTLGRLQHANTQGRQGHRRPGRGALYKQPYNTQLRSPKGLQMIIWLVNC